MMEWGMTGYVLPVQNLYDYCFMDIMWLQNFDYLQMQASDPVSHTEGLRFFFWEYKLHTLLTFSATECVFTVNTCIILIWI